MKKFFKKPLNIISLALTVIGIAVMIIMLAIPYGGKYKRTWKSGGSDYVKTIEFIKLVGNDMVEDELLRNGERLFGRSYFYQVEDGVLTYIGEHSGAKVNSFKIVYGTGEDQVVFKNNKNIAIFIAGCAVAVVGLAGIVYGALTVNKPKKEKEVKEAKEANEVKEA